MKHDTVDSGIPMFFIDDVEVNSSCTVLINTLEIVYLRIKMKKELTSGWWLQLARTWPIADSFYSRFLRILVLRAH